MQVQHTTITPAGSENLLKSNLGKMEQFVGMYLLRLFSYNLVGYTVAKIRTTLEYFTALQAATILVAMASEKKNWRLNYRRKSPFGDQRI